MFSSDEIEKAKQLKSQKLKWQPRSGHFIYARHCPAGCKTIAEGIHLIIDPHPEHSENVWLPQFDDLIEKAREYEISFSLITDFLHRRRFADKNEREGLYQLFIERLR